jgi:N-acetylglucosaminyldiphosphoundecaprenol N-acetyl-beta-D-mannosaminyltransferase
VRRSARRAWSVFAHRVAGQCETWLKRGFDILLATAQLLVLWPLLLLLRLVYGPMRRYPQLGRWCEPFDEFAFAIPVVGPHRIVRALRLHRLPALFNILRGDMSFVGPRPVNVGPAVRDRLYRRTCSARPGLVCLHWIRSRSNIDFEGEAASDAEYESGAGLRTDVGIALRAVPVLVYGSEDTEVPETVSLLGIRIDNSTMADAIDRLMADMAGTTPTHVCFVNADCANISAVNAHYRGVLARAAVVLADGIGMKIAGKLKRQPIRQNVNGTDLFPRLCAEMEAAGRSVYLLGGKPGVADGVRDWIEAHHPGLRVAGVQHGYFPPEQEPEVIAAIRSVQPSLLLVAMGAPRQDEWVAEHLAEAGARVGMGVGGLFDFFSGRVSRAPQWVRDVGFEWAFRLLQEPGRLWKRYVIGNVVFLWRIAWYRPDADAGRG